MVCGSGARRTSSSTAEWCEPAWLSHVVWRHVDYWEKKLHEELPVR